MKLRALIPSLTLLAMTSAPLRAQAPAARPAQRQNAFVRPPASRMPRARSISRRAAPIPGARRFLLPFRSQRWPAVIRTGRFGSHRGYGPHNGIDFAVPYRTPVYAARAGRVIRAEPFDRRLDYGRGYGGLVVVRHPDGSSSWYAHLDRVTARVGQKVTRRTKLGLSGGRNNGRSSGPHLHFMVLGPDGRPINPAIAFEHAPPQGTVLARR